MNETFVINEENLDGIVQRNPVVFAACESLSFMEYGEAFVKSVTGNGRMPCHVHIVNASPMVYDLTSQLIDDVDMKFTCTFEKLDTNGMTDADRAREYENSRYKNLPVVLSNAGKVMVLSIDTIVSDPIILPDYVLAISGSPDSPTTDALYIEDRILSVADVLAWYAHQRELTASELITHMSIELQDDIQWLDL